MSNTRLGDIVRLNTGDFAIAGLAGGNLRLRNTITTEYSVMHITELTARLLEPAHSDPITARAYEDASKDYSEEIDWLATHLQEMIDGTPRLPNTEMRDQYNPEKTRTGERDEAKFKELQASPMAPSLISLKRYKAKYLRGGKAALVDSRTTRTHAPLANVDPDLLAAISKVVELEANQSTGGFGRLRDRIEGEMRRLYPLEEPNLPSDSSLRDYVRQLTKGKYTLGNAKNRRTQTLSPTGVQRRRVAIAPGSECQIDTSTWDIMVHDSKGDAVRAYLTILIDKATQSILATSVVLDAAKGVDHALLLARAVVPRPLRPHSDHYLDLELPDMPWAAVLDADQAATYSTTRPFIYPRRIMSDNGRDFLSDTFRSACAQLGISLTEASSHRPTNKALVERHFETIKTEFAQYIPGFSGGAVDRRGVALEKQELLNLDELRELFDRWVDVVWQNTPRAGLRDPQNHHILLSPNAMYAASFDLFGVIDFPRTAEDYVRFLPSVDRTIQPDGIEYMYRMYDSAALTKWKGRPSANEQSGGKWAIKYDPYDATAVWFQDPDTMEFIECRWNMLDEFAKPHSARIRRQAREIAADHEFLNGKEARDMLMDLLASAQSEKKARLKHEARNIAAKAQEVAGGFVSPLTKTPPKVFVPNTLFVPADPQDEDDDDDDDDTGFGGFDPTGKVL